MKQLLLLVSVVCILTTLSSWYQEEENPFITRVHFQKGNWQSVLDSARIQKKSILVHCTADWCLPCKQMQRYTYSDSFLAAYLKKNYIVYEWQAENFDHIELNQRYKVERYPTILFITASGNEMSRLIGFQSANEIQKAGDLILHRIKLKTVSQTQTPVKKGTKK